MYIFIILIISAFCTSAFFSGSETIFSAVNKVKIRLWNKSGRTGANQIENLLKNPDKFLIPSLIGTNVSNVLYSSLIAYVITNFNINKFSHLEVTIYETLILVFFAEIIPKIIGKSNADQLTFIIIYPFQLFRILTFPIIFFLNVSTKFFAKILGIKNVDENHILATKNDIESIISEVVETSEIYKKNNLFLQHILGMKHSNIKEIITHRKDIISVNINNSIYELKKMIKATFFSKIVIYDKNHDNIKGIVYANDVLTNPKTIKEIIHDIRFIPATKSIFAVFQILKNENISIALIVDEFGGTKGIVTMHDIMEFIIGEAQTCFHNGNKSRGIIYRKQKNILIVNGETNIDRYNLFIENITDTNRYNFPEDKFETINGFLTDHLQKIPKSGEQFKYKNLNFKIITAKRNKIDSIIVNLKLENKK